VTQKIIKDMTRPNGMIMITKIDFYVAYPVNFKRYDIYHKRVNIYK